MLQSIENATASGVLGMFKENATYNMWANLRMVEWLKTKPADVLEKEIPSSFRGLRETLLHIWDVERYWLSVLQQVPAPPSFRFTGFDGSLQEIFDGLTETSTTLSHFVSSFNDEEELQVICHFQVPIRWPEWDDFYKPRTQIILHCMNHAAYHRGQLVTIGHQLGITDAPMSDYMAYLLTGKA